ncbi:MAG: HIT family protein [Candidatus Liptonbacteria bacterium]|nr:HIT family protein [Candidatus Liptonbacteria bacterium]
MCLFCSITSKEISAWIIYEDERTLAFLDIHPRAPGHTIVIPKSHSASLLDLEEKDFGPLLGAVKAVEKRILEVLHPEGFTVGVNQGRAAGQEVDHLHVHILPRFSSDGGKAVQGLVNNPPSESLKEMAEKLSIKK